MLTLQSSQGSGRAILPPFPRGWASQTPDLTGNYYGALREELACF